jgi:hypothetical protein
MKKAGKHKGGGLREETDMPSGEAVGAASGDGASHQPKNRKPRLSGVQLSSIGYLCGLLFCFGTPADNFERVLVDNPSALVADVQVFPASVRVNLFTRRVARVKALAKGRILADANPRLVVVRLVGYSFL